MPDHASELIAVIGSAPADLLDHCRAGNLPKYPDSRINCLPFEEARNYSRKMQGIPVVDRLGLWVLDDANDSNPFAYISRGPCAGMVIHFSHDPEPELAFPSLERYLASMRDAGTRGIDIGDIAVERMDVALDRDIRELAAEGTDDANFLIVTYLPVTASLESETKERLVSHKDFFVREALAGFLAQRSAAEDVSIAERLAKDRHPQVARAAKAAVAATRRKRHGG